MSVQQNKRRRLAAGLAALALLSLGLGLWQLGGAGWIHAKAWLAQRLLERSWAATLDDGGGGGTSGTAATPQRPWPWADTHPVAQLQVPAYNVDQIVLSGASGRTMAFGPGHLEGTAAPGTQGHSVIGGHRDTHFRFLEALETGDAIRLRRPDGGWADYRVSGTQIVDSRRARLLPDDGRTRLTLVTCYPFDAVTAGGPLRYLVFAVADAGA